MFVKLSAACFVVLTLLCFSCKKTNNSTSTTIVNNTVANVDSIKGTYIGTTVGDSIYTYLDTAGVTRQWVRSFTFPDTVKVIADDTIHFSVTSRLYAVNFTYGDSLTFDSVTNLSNQVVADNGVVGYRATLLDSANSLNHVIINVTNGYTKHMTSTISLLRR